MLGVEDFSFAHSTYHPERWTRLVPLARIDPSFLRVKKLFKKNWTHKHKPKPQIFAICQIISSEEMSAPYEEYKALVQLQGSQDPVANSGNEQLLFHGTTRACLLGEGSSHLQTCHRPECFLCSILWNSFDVANSGMKHQFKRFGTGIYTTACSSKADDYVTNLSEDSKCRVVLLNQVCVGAAFRTPYELPDREDAPPGYNSVVGTPGADLNYEETVVYSNDALRPAYIVVYGMTTKIKMRALVKTLFKTQLVSV